MIARRITFCFVYIAFALHLIVACSSPAQNLQGEHWTIFPEQQARKLGVAGWGGGVERLSRFPLRLGGAAE